MILLVNNSRKYDAATVLPELECSTLVINESTIVRFKTQHGVDINTRIYFGIVDLLILFKQYNLLKTLRILRVSG